MLTVEAFLATYTPIVRDTALKTRVLVKAVLPDAVENLDIGHKVIGYSSGQKMSDMIVYISAHKDSVNLGFTRGTSLPDPAGLLRGTGKTFRHAKLRKPEDVDNPALRALLETARDTHP